MEESDNSLFSTIKLPRLLSPPSPPHVDSENELAPGRRSFLLNPKPHGTTAPIPLKLPNLKTYSQQRSKFRESAHNLTPSTTKLTKQEQLLEESAATLSTDKKTEKLSVDLDKKLSSMHQSILHIEKLYRSVNDGMTDAVRRSVTDTTASTAQTGEKTNHQKAYQVESSSYSSQPQPEEIGEGKDDSWARKYGSRSDSFQLLVSAEKASSSSMSRMRRESFAGESEIKSHAASSSPKMSELEAGGECGVKVQEADKPLSGLGPIMEKLSDKEFLTKIKMRDEKASRSLQKLQNRINAVHHQVELDKRKAKLDGKREKLLYKPRKKEHLESVPESELELTGFLQTTGGRTGSWNSADHAVFLKIYDTWKGIPELIIEKTIFALKHNKTPKEVSAHYKWYEDCEALLEKNKMELRKWDESKRKEREMLCQIEAENRKAKLEEENRRLGRLKETRLREHQIARAKASQWKIKTQSRPINDDDRDREDLDPKDFRKEMEKLVEEVKALTRPYYSSIHSPRERIQSAAFYPKDSSGAQLKKKMSLSAPVRRLKKPSLTSSTKNIIEMINDPIALKTSRRDNFSHPNTVRDIAHNHISTFKADTFSHRIKKEEQTIKKFELHCHSMRSHAPHRIDELQIQQLPTSIQVFHSKRAVPSWRKVS